MTIRHRLERIVEAIDQLPPFPDTALRILDIADDPNSSADDVIEVIQFDQAITSNCLRVCNSSYFGLREKAKSIKHAVVLTGTDALVKIALTNCGKVSAFSAEHKGYGLHPGELWQHSVSCALLSQLLLKRAGKSDNHELFVSALLHDVGKLVIDGFIADDFEAMYSLMEEDGYGFVDAEREYYGIDHAELGGLIFRTWNFPQTLIDSVSKHHQRAEEGPKKGIEPWTALSDQVVHAVDGFFTAMQQSDPDACRIDAAILSGFDLSTEDIVAVACELPCEMKRAADLLSIR